MKRICILILLTMVFTACHRDSAWIVHGRAVPFEHTIQAYADTVYCYRCSLPVFMQAPAFNMHINTYANRYKNRFIAHLRDTAFISTPALQVPELTIKDSVYASTNRIVSIQLTCMHDMGQHREYDCQSFNYNCRSKRLLHDSDILDFNQRAEIDRLIQKHLPPGIQQPDTFRLHTPHALNIHSQGIVFTFVRRLPGQDSSSITRILIPCGEAGAIVKP
ncbi:MAG: hypothetical protein J5701_07030 [Bacteroidales bacterium]|nr:hypothetical protein [Bacteroidales bacterium]